MSLVYYVIHEAMQNTVFKKKRRKRRKRGIRIIIIIIINTPIKINDSP
jgi:hypothetical protein